MRRLPLSPSSGHLVERLLVCLCCEITTMWRPHTCIQLSSKSVHHHHRPCIVFLNKVWKIVFERELASVNSFVGCNKTTTTAVMMQGYPSGWCHPSDDVVVVCHQGHPFFGAPIRIAAAAYSKSNAYSNLNGTHTLQAKCRGSLDNEWILYRQMSHK